MPTPAEQFHDAASHARTLADADDVARLVWRAYAEGHLDDDAASAAAEALEARRRELRAVRPEQKPRRRRAGSPTPRREKVFGDGRPRPMDRNAKARIMTLARSLVRRTVKGKAYGVISAKALAVLEALVWGFHNARTGLCFPSYEKIAERAACARSTVGLAIKALEAACLLTWCHRLARVHVQDPVLGSRERVIRTSNGYRLHDPKGPESKAIPSKSDFRSGTGSQESTSSLTAPKATGKEPPTALDEALARWRAAREAAKGLPATPFTS